MKKTFTANISGTVFHIEEDAYEQLQRYFAGLRAQFNGSAGSDEIMADIEARIAELFTERLQGRQVVTIADVDHVKSVMGQPEDIGDAPGAGEQAPPFSGPRGRRRLFRDPDDHWVGGVIGGISTYFNMDPLWLRIAFIVILIAGWGSPVLLYLLLWILIPKADTPAERLEMRGEPVTAENIKRAFDEGSQRFRQGAERVAGEAQNLGRRWSSGGYQQHSQRIVSNAERFFLAFFQVVGKVIGVFLLLFGGLLAFLIITLAVGGVGWGLHGFTMSNGTSLHSLADLWFATGAFGTWAWFALAIFLLVPVLGMILAGIRLVFEIRIPRWLGWTIVPAWFISIAVLSIIGVRQANDFRQRDHISEVIDLHTPADRIFHVDAQHDPWFGDSHRRHDEDIDMIEVDGQNVHWGWTTLDIQTSDDTLFHLEVVRSAQGMTIKEASRRAQGIQFQHMVQDSLISIAPFYTTARSERLRGQSVAYILHVPVGGAVRFERGSGRIIYDIDNTTNTYDGDMVGRTWTMTPAGLRAGIPSDASTWEKSMPEDEQDKKEEKDEKTNVTIKISERKPALNGVLGTLTASMGL